VGWLRNLWSIPGGTSLVDENIAKRKIENPLSPFTKNVLGELRRGRAPNFNTSGNLPAARP
jgi:hypothetical protein